MNKTAVIAIVFLVTFIGGGIIAALALRPSHPPAVAGGIEAGGIPPGGAASPAAPTAPAPEAAVPEGPWGELDQLRYQQLTDDIKLDVQLYKLDPARLRDPATLTYWVAINDCERAALNRNEGQWKRIADYYTTNAPRILDHLPAELMASTTAYLGSYDAQKGIVPLLASPERATEPMVVREIPIAKSMPRFPCPGMSGDLSTKHAYNVRFKEPINLSFLRLTKEEADALIGRAGMDRAISADITFVATAQEEAKDLAHAGEITFYGAPKKVVLHEKGAPERILQMADFSAGTAASGGMGLGAAASQKPPEPRVEPPPPTGAAAFGEEPGRATQGAANEGVPRVVAKRANVRKTPNPAGEKVGVAEPGTRVREMGITQEPGAERKWAFVGLPDGTTGFMSADLLEPAAGEPPIKKPAHHKEHSQNKGAAFNPRPVGPKKGGNRSSNGKCTFPPEGVWTCMQDPLTGQWVPVRMR
jgi:hypothetical protein